VNWGKISFALTNRKHKIEMCVPPSKKKKNAVEKREKTEGTSYAAGLGGVQGKKKKDGKMSSPLYCAKYKIQIKKHKGTAPKKTQAGGAKEVGNYPVRRGTSGGLK